jgi:NADH-quinone oxidoreductase subunit D
MADPVTTFGQVDPATGLKPMVINLGPQHPSTHGVLRVRLALDGEQVRACEPVIGYLHTGIEKNCEDLTFNQAITLTDRMDYLSPITNNFAYVLGVERLLGVEVPKRCQYIRVMFAELSRIASHLVWLGTSAMDMGAMSPFFYTMQQREQILDLIEMSAGTRMNPSYFRVGGLLNDLPPGFEEKLRAFLDGFPHWLQEYYRLLDRNPIWLERLKGTAPISAEQAMEYAWTGPLLRACGIDRDLRKTNPYSSYEDFEFDVATETAGDVYARYHVRMREMQESLRIIRQAIDNLPAGDWHVPGWKIYPPDKAEIGRNMEALIYHFKLFTEGIRVPAGEVYSAVEGPKGEIGFFIVSDGSGKPYRVRARGPSFFNLQALPVLVQDRILADVVAAIGSIDIVLGEVDR